eukprot:6317108-Amphidinium_carterae.1
MAFVHVVHWQLTESFLMHTLEGVHTLFHTTSMRGARRLARTSHGVAGQTRASTVAELYNGHIRAEVLAFVCRTAGELTFRQERPSAGDREAIAQPFQLLAAYAWPEQAEWLQLTSRQLSNREVLCSALVHHCLSGGIPNWLLRQIGTGRHVKSPHYGTTLAASLVPSSEEIGRVVEWLQRTAFESNGHPVFRAGTLMDPTYVHMRVPGLLCHSERHKRLHS